jgi:mannose-1-phosphate guanylyltransferase
MQALILVGGEATRLRPLTCNMPKAMVPVLNTPFLEHVILYLGKHGIKEVVLAQGHLPKPMDDYFKDGSRFGTKLTYALEAKPMNTAGAVKNAEQFLRGRFYVLNGDIFTDLDLTDMLNFHQASKAKVTIALTPVEDPTAYGLIETDATGRVTRFLEKPSRDQITTNMINAGTYILEPEILNDIPANTNYSFERQLFPMLLERGEPVYAYSSSSYWMDIGTPDRYFQVHQDLLNGKSRGYELTDDGEVQIGKQCRVDPTCKMQGKILIGDNCSIGPGVTLVGPVILGPGSSVLENAVIQESIAWRNVTFGPRSIIKNSLIANDCYLDAECSAEKTIIGDHINVTSKTRLGPGSRVWPTTLAAGKVENNLRSR